MRSNEVDFNAAFNRIMDIQEAKHQRAAKKLEQEQKLDDHGMTPDERRNLRRRKRYHDLKGKRK